LTVSTLDQLLWERRREDHVIRVNIVNPPIEVGPAFLPMDESRDRLFHRGVHLGRFTVRTPRRRDKRLVQVFQAPHWRT
jgi:hypothetical protein